MTIEKPENLEELERYIDKYKEQIYVREKVNEKWDSYSLKELPEDISNQHKIRFLKEGRIPLRLKTIEEMKNDELIP